MKYSTAMGWRFALALALAPGCGGDKTTEPEDVPSEQELEESAESICLLERMCAGAHETEDELRDCAGIIRNQASRDVSECDWLWLETNECLTDSTCENYALHDAHKQGDCSEQYQEWQNCRRDLMPE